MNSILESIFYGENPPCENIHLTNPNPNCKNLQHQYNQIQQSLLSQLEGKHLHLFKKLESLNLNIQSLVEKDCWTEGFKAGVQVMVESLDIRNIKQFTE